MKKYIYITIFAIATIFVGCEKFLTTDPYQQIDADQAFERVSDADNALNGLYNIMGNYRVLGNYAIAIGDFASDIAVADGATGHFVSINNYEIADYLGELTLIWEYGYKLINGSTVLIKESKRLLSENANYPDQVDQLNLILAEAYGLRAYTYFKLVNLFGLPYGTNDNPHGGLILMDEEPILPEQPVSRSSVVETYELILKDINSSAEYFGKTTLSRNQYYFNPAANSALHARVALFMKDYAVASAKASEAITLRNAPEISDEDYTTMWFSTAITSEDIFTIVKSPDDNLSANALNTLYGSYGGSLTDEFLADFDQENDIRFSLIGSPKDPNHPKKFDGLPSSAATSNIPQFRVSEMYLIIAEAEAQLGNIAVSQENLFYTAKRNKAITSSTDLPGDVESLLSFISKERKRELFTEGHRWYDARRTGELISVVNGSVQNYDVAKFVYPIPSDEINSGYNCEQNDGWEDALP
ncbi:MAG: RagB/SusD family nutrient uptake outer membrane protein [Bacteroidales bacterium]|jgi:hypothetical protein